MTKPKLMAVGTAVVMAGISNALIYTLGFVALLLFQFATKDAGEATLASASSALIITLMFTLFLATIITFIVAFPMALICRAFGFVGNKAFVIAPAIDYAENYIKVNSYFGGQAFSSADIIMEFVATYIKSMPFDPATYPKLAEWQAKVQQRPAYLRAMIVGAPDGLEKYRPKPKPAA